ncbi:MAG: Stp1/IreP family PP2C-type Ser/Thr phosphatase [Anaerolineaceae bacterium]
MQTFFEINYGIKSDVGRIRKNNEDYITCFVPADAEELKKNGSLFIVADGVGGAAKGEVASHFAGDTVIYEYYNNTELPPAERLARVMQKASREIYDHSQGNGNFTRMATTMVAALILQNNLIVAHVGDSRLYLIREGKIKQITRDHSVVAEMVRNGVMTEEEARTSKAKNRLSRSIGGEADVHVDISAPIPLNLGDRILLCSDGLTRYLDGEDLKDAALKGDVESVTKELVKYANEQGGVDNVSAILLEMVQKAKIRPKKPATRQIPPEKLGWDEAETEYPVKPIVEPSKKIPNWVFAAGIFILLFAYFISTHGKNNTDVEITEMGFVQTSQMETETVIPSVTISPEEFAIGVANFRATIQSGYTPTPTQNWQCVYKIESGNGISVLLSRFGEEFNQTKEYYSYDNCTTKQDSFFVDCALKEKISDPVSYLPKGEYLIVFDSSENDQSLINQKQKICEEGGGKIFNPKAGGSE